MNVQHTELAQGRWAQLSVVEQMAHIGSEVSRALNWRRKGNDALCERAVTRALELLDLSLSALQTRPRLREVARVREAVVDFFYDANQYASSESLWRRYFDHFAYATRRSS